MSKKKASRRKKNRNQKRKGRESTRVYHGKPNTSKLIVYFLELFIGITLQIVLEIPLKEVLLMIIDFLKS